MNQLANFHLNLIYLKEYLLQTFFFLFLHNVMESVDEKKKRKMLRFLL